MLKHQGRVNCVISNVSQALVCLPLSACFHFLKKAVSPKVGLSKKNAKKKRIVPKYCALFDDYIFFFGLFFWRKSDELGHE